MATPLGWDGSYANEPVIQKSVERSASSVSHPNKSSEEDDGCERADEISFYKSLLGPDPPPPSQSSAEEMESSAGATPNVECATRYSLN